MLNTTNTYPNDLPPALVTEIDLKNYKSIKENITVIFNAFLQIKTIQESLDKFDQSNLQDQSERNIFLKIKACIDDAVKDLNLVTKKQPSKLSELITLLNKNIRIRENMIRLFVMNQEIEKLFNNSLKSLNIFNFDDKKTLPLHTFIINFFSRRLTLPLQEISEYLKKLNNIDLKDYLAVAKEIENETIAVQESLKKPTLENAENIILLLRQKRAKENKIVIQSRCIELAYLLTDKINQILANNKYSLDQDVIKTLLDFKRDALRIYLHKDNVEFVHTRILRSIKSKLKNRNQEKWPEEIYNQLIQIVYHTDFKKNNLNYNADFSCEVPKQEKQTTQKIVVNSDTDSDEEISAAEVSKTENNKIQTHNKLKYAQLIEYENVLQQQFIRFASYFITDYLTKDKTRRFKNALKHNLMVDLKEEFQLLYSLSLEQRQQEMWQHECTDILALWIHILKEKLRKYHLNFSDLTGEFKKSLDSKLSELSFFNPSYQTPITDLVPPTPKQRLLESKSNSTKMKKFDVLIGSELSPNNKAINLIGMLLMTCDYYEGNYLGKQLADKNSVPHNARFDSDHLKEIKNLANIMITNYINFSTNNVELTITGDDGLLSCLKITINNILDDYKIWSRISDSRLAGTLIHIYNLFAPANKKFETELTTLPEDIQQSLHDIVPDYIDKPSKHQYKDIFLPLEVFNSTNLTEKEANDASLYVYHHVANQLLNFFISYKTKISSRTTTSTNPLKILVTENIINDLNNILQCQDRTELGEVNNVIVKIREIFDKHTTICGESLSMLQQGEFGDTYKKAEKYLNSISKAILNEEAIKKTSGHHADLKKAANPILAYLKQETAGFALYPTPWAVPSVKILLEFNRLYNLTPENFNKKMKTKGFTSHAQFFKSILSEADPILESDPNGFERARKMAYQNLGINRINNDEENDSSQEQNQNNITKASQAKKLIVCVLQICDYYRNTKLGKQLVSEKNEKTYFAHQIQNLANTLLKYSSRNEPDVKVVLQHIKDTIKKIRNITLWGSYSRLANTLEQLHDNYSRKKTYSNTSKETLPSSLSNCHEDKKQLAIYRRRHIIAKVQELLGQYETHLRNSWLSTFKFTHPFKKSTTAQLHYELDKLYRSGYNKELDDNHNDLVNKLKSIFREKFTSVDGKTPLTFFSKAEFGKTKRAFEVYLDSISMPEQTFNYQLK